MGRKNDDVERALDLEQPDVERESPGADQEVEISSTPDAQDQDEADESG